MAAGRPTLKDRIITLVTPFGFFPSPKPIRTEVPSPCSCVAGKGARRSLLFPHMLFVPASGGEPPRLVGPDCASCS